MRYALKYGPNHGFQAIQLSVALSASIELLNYQSDLTKNKNEKKNKTKQKQKKTNGKKNTSTIAYVRLN